MSTSAREKLNEKQRKFVVLHVAGGFSMTKAYRMAGYQARGKAAESAASRLLRNVKVAAYADELRGVAEKGAVASLQETLEFLTLALRVPLSEIDEDHPLCVEFVETVTESGSTKRVKKVDPLKAIQEISKLMNRYAPQEVKHGVDDELSEILNGIAQTGGTDGKM